MKRKEKKKKKKKKKNKQKTTDVQLYRLHCPRGFAFFESNTNVHRKHGCEHADTFEMRTNFCRDKLAGINSLELNTPSAPVKTPVYTTRLRPNNNRYL